MTAEEIFRQDFAQQELLDEARENYPDADPGTELELLWLQDAGWAY